MDAVLSALNSLLGPPSRNEPHWSWRCASDQSIGKRQNPALLQQNNEKKKKNSKPDNYNGGSTPAMTHTHTQPQTHSHTSDTTYSHADTDIRTSFTHPQQAVVVQTMWFVSVPSVGKCYCVQYIYLYIYV